jgi:hypothetical protein
MEITEENRTTPKTAPGAFVNIGTRFSSIGSHQPLHSPADCDPVQFVMPATAPTVFLSAATIDLKPLRDLLAKAFRAAQFRVQVQDDSLGAGLENVRRLLADAIDQSDCVIHLAGQGYGSHATAPFPEHDAGAIPIQLRIIVSSYTCAPT